MYVVRGGVMCDVWFGVWCMLRVWCVVVCVWCVCGVCGVSAARSHPDTMVINTCELCELNVN